MHTYHIEFLELLNGQVQYVVPRWQRRYCWDRADIERLVDDLMTVAEADPERTHYGGTLLTFPEPGAVPGVVKTIRVVDGQQRLTTVSILLACIAEKLGPNGQCGEWTAEILREHRLTNSKTPPQKRRKLRLQDGDEEEYRRGLDSRPSGPGAITQAWRIARRLVAKNDTAMLLRGLERLRVVSIGLESHDDPQQIFESLNATGRPLTESEKVKNWLLIGLPDAVQQEMHDEHWRSIEQSLGAERTTAPIDLFLRDVLRWRTGEVHGIDQVYEGLRRWAVRTGHVSDRRALFQDLARLARLYGILAGTAGAHPNRMVERELRHIRAMGIDIHRPFTLRVLNDAADEERIGATTQAAAKTLATVATWSTRLWLADRPTAGLNRAIADLAHEPGPGDGEDYANHWIERIRRLRNTSIEVPDDEQIVQGIRTRKAYGSSATQASFAILCALMESEQREEAPPRPRLTIEHVMPQKLTDEWRNALGDEAEETHGRYRDRLANLTLSGDLTNPALGAKPFDAKKPIYGESSIAMTRRLATESAWNAAAIERRAEDLARRALEHWAWLEPTTTEARPRSRTASLRWRIDNGEWRSENAASQMVLNVAGTLLSRDPTNVERLSGEAVSSNVHPTSRYPAGTRIGTLTMYAIPGHAGYVLWPYAADYRESADRCRKMGGRCGVRVEVEFEQDNQAQSFWRLLKELTGGIPGQKDTWRGVSQWTIPLNESGDRIGVYVGNADLLWLYIRSGQNQDADVRSARARNLSWTIQDQMSDQELGDNLEKSAGEGLTLTVQRPWNRDDEDEWPEAVRWITDRQSRLQAILTELDDLTNTID